MRKMIAGIALATVLCLHVGIGYTDSAAAAEKTSADFSDLVDLDAATRAKFDEMIAAGVFEGVAEGEFGLKNEMNRAQFAKVAALIFKLDVDTSVTHSSFSDVRADDPANGYALPFIEAVKHAGITDGVADGVYDPAGKVTKEQLAAFLVKGLGLKDEALSSKGVDDDTVSEWAKGYVEEALKRGLVSGNADGSFGGQTNATREELVLSAAEAKTQYQQIEENKMLEEQQKKEEEERNRLEEEEEETWYPSPWPDPKPAVVEAPAAAPAGGIAAPGTSVALTSATEDASLYYTTDLSEPTTSSLLYTGPIVITNSTTIQVIAVKPGMTNSAVSVFQFTVPVELPESIASDSSLVAGQVYSGSVTASGGTGSFTYSVAGGQLPPGLTLDADTGVITGTPSMNGTYNFTILAADSAVSPATASMSYTMTVAPPEPDLTQLTSDPADVALTAAGETAELAITAGFSNDTSDDVTEDAQYESGNVNVATVSAEGIVTAVSAGTTNIVVTYGGLTINVPVTVTIEPPAPILTHLTSDSANVMLTAIGETSALAITALFDNDSSTDVTGEAQYESGDVSVATVSADGVITAVANGTANIVVTYGGKILNVPVLVTVSRQLEFIDVMIPVVQLPVGMGSNIIVTAFFDDESVEIVTEFATIESEHPDLVTIEADGYFTALQPGETKFKATFLTEEFTTGTFIIW